MLYMPSVQPTYKILWKCKVQEDNEECIPINMASHPSSENNRMCDLESAAQTSLLPVSLLLTSWS